MSVLSGVIPALVTPFDANNAVDDDSLRRLVAWQIEVGANGLLINGLAGEGIFLSIEEREHVTEIVASVAGDLALLVGCTADTTEDACRLVRGAAERGAVAVMVAPPRKPDWSREQFRVHYRAVASASECEVMVQDAPFAIGVELGVDLVLELAAEIDTIRAYKIEALPYWENAVRASAVAGDRLGVFGGHGGVYLMDVLDSGSVGLIPGADVTATLVRAWNAFQSGARVVACEEYMRVLPLLVFQAQSMGMLIGGAKTLLQAQGIIQHTHVRHPDASLSATTCARMLQLAREVGEMANA